MILGGASLQQCDNFAPHFLSEGQGRKEEICIRSVALI